MKRVIWFLLVWAATTLPGLASGLIIIHDGDFWSRDGRILPPHPVPIPRPPPYRPPPQPVWAPMEVTFNQVNVQIKDQIAVTKIVPHILSTNSPGQSATAACELT